MIIKLVLFTPHSLIKMLYSMCQVSKEIPTWPQLEHAIKRNFGGMEDENFNPIDLFKSEIYKCKELNLSAEVSLWANILVISSL